MSTLLLILLFILGISGVAYCFLWPRWRSYQKEQRMLEQIEDEYERLRSTRKSVLYHVDWAVERGERKEARELEEELDRIDAELADLREKYDAFKGHKTGLKFH
eukprot:GILJ01010312.1.p1 GENE.GILJ01010312.1~~GILJ01010312.1.p1  ORF type:complete len:104 (-),score=10.26 GILJ01010312.1:142-453(-)